MVNQRRQGLTKETVHNISPKRRKETPPRWNPDPKTEKYIDGFMEALLYAPKPFYAVYFEVLLDGALFAGAFLGAAAVVDFVTRPDLVLPKTLGTSTTAGACAEC